MPPERSSLLALQREFGLAIKAAGDPVSTHEGAASPWVAPPPVAAADRLAVYRNNAWQFFRTALELTYPVVCRRVGEDFFAQLAREYREARPSRSGDLHWVGEAFPDWLARRFEATDYAWLADLARLEWACEAAGTARRLPALPLQALGELPRDRLDEATLALQPSLQLLASSWPVWSVWQANQGEDPGAPVDLATGAEHCAVACTDDQVVVYRIDPRDFALLAALARGETLAGALVATGLEADVLGRVLGWAFGEQLVVALNPSARA